MEFPKIIEVIEPEGWAKNDAVVELIVYEKMVDVWVKVILISGIMLMFSVVF